ncbi:Down syndrome cell adhesion molecule-like protein 1 homolog [Galendromus occidentalis]|uniref:Down syndrome cell adhesion molecule-like protein 1 homolog n=1 Tax=Galendromus occidentalis TaxID=34638 RepID=A0AAJ7WIE6_9ACAR|nr:Down syndrome cell adhesion molecule-like protein 1 homolog [Galendromus occidentalis]
MASHFKMTPPRLVVIVIVTTLSSAPVIAGEAPRIGPMKIPDDLKEGQRLAIMCAVLEGGQPLSFTWRKDGVPLGPQIDLKILQMDEYQEQLQILKLSTNHIGNYTCEVKNAYGSDHISIQVLMKFRPEWLLSGETSPIVSSAGSRATVDCRSKGYPKPDIHIKKDQLDLIVSSDRRNIRDGLLEIDNVGSSDGGLYQCEASNSIGSISKSIKLTLKDTREIAPSERIRLSDGIVRIAAISSRDKGEYACEASNALGKITRSISVHLSVPARFKEKASVVTSRRSDTTNLKCYAVGDHPISVVWSKGNVKLDKRTSSRYEIIESITTDGMSSELRIRETDRADSALYTCHTENKYGTDDRKVKLVVKDVPGAPQDVKVKDIWSRSVALHWTPSYDGNSPITKFIVTYWRDQGLNFRQQELEVSSAQHFTLVRDLQPGTHYVLNVVAENVIGKSEASRTVTFTTNEEEPEAPPIDVNAITQGPTSILVSWKAPEKNSWNGDIEGYYIGFRPKASKKTSSFRKVEQKNNVTHEYILQGLNRGTEYAITVQAYNHAGSGPSSPQSLVMTRPEEGSPEVPRLFVDAVAIDSIKLRWQLRTGGQHLNYTINHRQADGGAWLEHLLINSTENTYTLEALRSGTTYEIFLTAINGAIKSDPSQILKVQTLRSSDNGLVEIFDSNDMPLYLNMYLVIPAAALALAVIVIVISSCICCRQMKNIAVPPMPQEMALYGTMMPQRYVDAAGNELTVTYGTVPDPAAMAMQSATMAPGANPTGTWSRKEAPKNRPLPIPTEATDKATGHFYDSAQ